jgi:predicted GNAT family acetyltransferase
MTTENRGSIVRLIAVKAHSEREPKMEVRLHDSVDDFREVAVDIYRCNPVEATVELMVLRGRVMDRNPAPLLVTVWNGGAAVGAAFQTLHSPLLCTGLPEATVADVVAEIVGMQPSLNGVRGPRAIATKFAAAWRVATGMLSAVSAEEQLYRLERLHPPTAVAGESRTARDGDRDMLVDWLNRFRAEAFGVVADPAVDARQVRTAKEGPDEFLLWTLDNIPVTMAGVRLPTAGVSRLGPIYTPTDRRGHGYGAAAGAAAAAWALEAGADEVVLFAELANRRINAIYQSMGFRPVSEFVRIDFSVPGNGPTNAV